MALQYDKTGDNLELLYEYNVSSEAYIAMGVLESNGVPAVVDNSIMATLLGGISPVGNYRLMVRRKDLDIARKILAEAPAAPPTETEE
jgi:hypothetical protein